MLQLFGAELALRIADLSSALLGPYATVEAPTEAIPDAGALAPSRAWRPTIHNLPAAPGRSSAIIGERVLGSPKV
jgi:hypothetical protein